FHGGTMTRLSLPLAVVICVTMLVAGCRADDRAVGDSIPTLSDYISRLSVERRGPERFRLFCELMEDLDERTVILSSSEDARRLALLSAHYVESDPDTSGLPASEFLARYPHPAATEVLLRAAKATRHPLVHERVLEALVSLHEKRALPVLIADLQREPSRDSRSTLRLIVDLGDRDAIEPVQRF